MSRASLHPLVDRFFAVETGTLAREFKADPDPLVQAVLKTLEALGDPSQAQETLESAGNLRLEGADTNLVILMLHFLAMLSANSPGRMAEAKAFHHRADALITSRTPRQIAALVLSIEAHFAAEAGRWAQREELLQHILQWVPAEVPRRQMWVMWYCEQLYFQGRGLEAKAHEDKLKGFYSVERIAISKANDNLERCMTRELLSNLELWARGTLKIPLAETARKGCGLFAALLCNQWPHGPPREPDSNAANSEIPQSFLSTYALQQCQERLALQWAQVDARINPGALNGLDFAAFALLRAELACGNAEAASRLLQMRQRHGTLHYMDDFFQARIYSLRGEHDVAAEHFTRCWRTAKKYEAEARLNFELSLSCELAPLDLARLVQGKITPGAPRKPSFPKLNAVQAQARGLVGKSKALAAVRERIRQFAPLAVPVLITGETGTGKEMVARALHESGPRAKRPFIAVNCGAIAETLLESELFGHARGAFTGAERERMGIFEEAGQGTLFLDEIGEISQRLQVSLLRVLENQEVRPVGSNRSRKIACRVVFATNIDLDDAVQRGTFRSDLLYRLKRLELQLPALRERPVDILPLVDYFLNLERIGNMKAALSPELEKMFVAYAWPGNVRELRNDVEQLRLLNSDKTEYAVDDLAPGPKEKFCSRAAAEPRFHAPDTEESSVAEFLKDSKLRLRRMQRLKDLFAHHGTLTRREVAHILGISPITAARDLRVLTDDNFIVRIEPNRSAATHYFKRVQ